jgi:pantothenate kinase
MLVQDIYGEVNPFKELKGEWVASSFAKVANDHTTPGDQIKDKYKKEDVLNSLMFMISVNIG